MRRRGRSGNINNNSNNTQHHPAHSTQDPHIYHGQSATDTAFAAVAAAAAVVATERRHNSNSNNNNHNNNIALNMSGSGGGHTSRKDDPVFNVKFVQLVESHPCLWNSTLPAYSKKNEVERAWQNVAVEIKDSVRNCRERWRTIRSSFLRSLKLSRTSTGRGKRKYYLSKYLQFLIPYTKTRLKTGNGSSHSHTTLPRKVDTQGASVPMDASPATAASETTVVATAESETTATMVCKTLLPMTRINHMPFPIVNSDDTKDSTNSEIAIAEEDVLVSLHEGATSQAHLQLPHAPQTQTQQHQQRLMTIKSEQGVDTPSPDQRRCTTANGPNSSSNNNNNNNNSNMLVETMPTRSASAVDLTEFAEWIKSKNEHLRHCLMSSTPTAPDADQSFLNSLYPFLKEMTGKQNRRFRQKVVALIDAILDNAD